ncbi:MAG: hypothetical protein AAF371_12200 [Pseudomonadota bacterium]
MTVPSFTTTDAVPAASTGPIVLLVAEASPYRRLLTALIEFIGCRPVVMEPGRAAVEYARANPPAMVLMSLFETEAPVIDTATLIRTHLRALTPPMIALVDVTCPKRRAALERLAFDAVEPKLFDVQTLEDLVEGVIYAPDLCRH